MAAWRAAIPVLVLAVVALHQIALAKLEGLNPWKGGGFGMFATLDRASARSVRAFAEGDAGLLPLAIPDAQEPLRLRARELPSERNLRALAAALRDEAPAGTRALRIEVWRATPDPAGGPTTPELLRRARVQGGGGAGR